MSASSFPPVLATEHAASYLQHLRRCAKDFGSGSSPVPLSPAEAPEEPAFINLAARVVLPALEHAARVGIARMQASGEERHR